MARSAQGIQLTAQHRQLQLAIRAATVRDYMRLWPLWTGDEATFANLVTAAIPLATTHHRVSVGVAARYYQQLRRAEGVSGSFTPILATLDPKAVTTSLYVTGQVMTRNALAAGQQPEAAMKTALVRTSGALSRHVLNGGRQTVVQSAFADPRSGRYARVTSGEGCDFCEMLAGRGAVYREDTADFQAHDHCACGAEPEFD